MGDCLAEQCDMKDNECRETHLQILENEKKKPNPNNPIISGRREKPGKEEQGTLER